MPLSFKVSGPDGEGWVTSQEVLQDLQEGGFEPIGLSPDGMSVTFMGSKGQFSKPIPEIAQQMGMQVGEVLPENPGTDLLDTGLRFSVETIPDDDSRRMFLQSKIDRQYGEKAPKVMGQGSDWYFVDPNSGQYQALTNAPGIDQSDIGQLGAVVPKLAAETAGYAMAGPLGGGAGNMAANSVIRTIAGAKEGKGLEQFANFMNMSNMSDPMKAGALTEERYDLGEQMKANMDPDYMAAFPQDEQGTEMLKEGGISTAFGGLASGMGKAFPAARSFMQSGPFSRGAEAVGGAAEVAGAGAKHAGAFATGGPLRRETMAYMAPGVGDVALAGTMARLPRGAATMGVEGLESLGRSEFAKKTIGEGAAGKIAGFAEEVAKPRPGVDMAEQVLSGSRGISPEGRIGTNTRDIFGNIGEMTGKKFQDIAHQRALSKLLAGKDPGISSFMTQAADMAAERLPRAGEIFGQGLENLGKAGRAVERGAIGLTTGLGKGVQYGGAGVEMAGRGLSAGARGLRPVEPYAWYGAGRSAIPDWPKSEEEIIFDRWRKRRERDNMGLDFAMAGRM